MCALGCLLFYKIKFINSLNIRVVIILSLMLMMMMIFSTSPKLFFYSKTKQFLLIRYKKLSEFLGFLKTNSLVSHERYFILCNKAIGSPQKRVFILIFTIIINESYSGQFSIIITQPVHRFIIRMKKSSFLYLYWWIFLHIKKARDDYLLEENKQWRIRKKRWWTEKQRKTKRT